MKNVIIKKQNNITHSAIFSSLEEANVWIDAQRALKSWGKTAGFYGLSELSEQELLTEISRINEIDNKPLFEPLINIPDQFSILIEDITEEMTKRNLELEGLKRQQIGSQIMAMVFRINAQKNLSSEQFELLMSDAQMARLERLIWNGSLSTAKSLIQTINETFFSLDEKAEILTLLGDY